MKKILLSIASCLFIAFNAIAQDLYVSPNSYMFVNDQVLFVNDDIRLEANTSFIYLRNLSQLVQNTDTKNSDTGDLSVIQDQTVGIYQYNNWASPVGHSNNSTNTNRNFDVRELYYDTGLITSTQYTANAPNVAFIDGTATEIATYWLHRMETGNSYTDWVQFGNTNLAVQPGYGFTMKGNGGAGNDYDFRGRPNTGDISINIDNSGPMGYSETLAGNPYPSALDLKLFLIDAANTAVDGNAYFWQQAATTHYLEDYDGGYGVYVPVDTNPANDGLWTPPVYETYDDTGAPQGPSGTGPIAAFTGREKRFCPIGQGFMLRGDGSGTATFTNNMRVFLREGAGNSVFGLTDGIPNDTSTTESTSFASSTPTSDDNETNNDNTLLNDINRMIPQSHNGIDYEDAFYNRVVTPHVSILTNVNDTYTRTNLLAFAEGADNTFEKYKDGNMPLQLRSDAYFVFENKVGVVQTTHFDIDQRVPFGFTADEGGATFEVSLGEIVNFDTDQVIYIHDKELNTYTNLKTGNFEITLDQGDYKNRFEIVFRNAQQDQIDDIIEDVVDTFDIFQDNNGSALIIKNPELVDIKSVGLYDVAGKQVYNKVNLQTQDFYSFPSNNLSDGIYIVKLITANNLEIGKKVSVSNRK